MGVLASYATFVAYLKIALLSAGVVLALVCALDWAVRTRRISPFSGVARFFRTRVDPLMAPVERVIVRSGGVPTTAPWWSLVALALFGILLLSLLQFAYGILSQAMFAVAAPSTIGITLASWAFGILRLALLVRVISSWLPISPSSRWIRWSYVLTNWMIAPLQRVIPRIGMIDITPIVAWILLNVIQGVFGIP
jgi:YggT family protein